MLGRGEGSVGSGLLHHVRGRLQDRLGLLHHVLGRLQDRLGLLHHVLGRLQDRLGLLHHVLGRLQDRLGLGSGLTNFGLGVGLEQYWSVRVRVRVSKLC